jgi:hypothetical protein
LSSFESRPTNCAGAAKADVDAQKIDADSRTSDKMSRSEAAPTWSEAAPWMTAFFMNFSLLAPAIRSRRPLPV